VVKELAEGGNFLNANVYILPPENGESDGDSEVSDDDSEQCLSRPFAEHLTPQILKGTGSVEFVDESGIHVIDDESASDVTSAEDQSDELWSSDVSAPSASVAKKRVYVKQQSSKPKQPRTEQLAEPVTTEKSTAAVLLCEGLPREWKKTDIDEQQCGKFNWNNLDSGSLPDMEPSGYFELFWNNELFEQTKTFSKLYATQQDPRSSFDVSVDELKVMVGILLMSGYNVVPRRRLYWSTETDVRNEMIASAMSRNRFDELLSKLHCADNTSLPDADRFGKVRPLIKRLNQKYLDHWPVDQKVSIDESMIPYYGHHGCKQHIHGKPVRFGFKIWSLNASSDGYCIQLEPYQGAGSGMRFAQLGLGGSVVVDLISKLPHNVPFHIYADNFFSSLNLVDHLSQSTIGYTGTIRENRTQKCPVMPNKEIAKKKRGEVDFRQDMANKLILAKWHDNAVVSVVSNCHGVTPLHSATRWSAKERKQLTVPVPDLVHQYNRYMGGTDLMDRNISNYRISVRMKKWWWSVFSFLLSSSVVNAWCIHRRVKAEKFDLLNFTRQIAITYLLNCSKRCEIGRPVTTPQHVMRRVVPDDVRTSAGHFPISTKQNRCRVCQKNTKRGCGKCGINLHDCCFMVFHDH